MWSQMSLSVDEEAMSVKSITTKIKHAKKNMSGRHLLSLFKAITFNFTELT